MYSFIDPEIIPEEDVNSLSDKSLHNTLHQVDQY